MSKKLKKEVTRLLEKRTEKENEKEEQDYIKPDPPKDFWLDTTEVERLKIENIGLKRMMLHKQQQELEGEMNKLFSEIKTRAEIDLSAHVTVNPQDVSKILISFKQNKKEQNAT